MTETPIRWMWTARETLVARSTECISACLGELRHKGMRMHSGARLKTLVVGLLFLLRSGVTYKNLVLMPALPEIAHCLPHETRLEHYFGISSKAICSAENEMKLVFRDWYQK
jgi:hypothetical protein